jgi:hypothetical protein
MNLVSVIARYSDSLFYSISLQISINCLVSSHVNLVR